MVAIQHAGLLNFSAGTLFLVAIWYGGTGSFLAVRLAVLLMAAQHPT